MNEQPGLLVNLGKFSSCFLTQVTDGVGYVQLDPNISCADPEYIRFSGYFVFPALLFWGGIIPIGIFLMLYVSRRHHDNPEFRIKYGGIINSYRGEVYYWGVVTMLYKLCLLVSLVLIQTPSTAFFTGQSITIAYYLLFRKLHPYTTQEFVDMENYSILTYILTLYLLGYASSGKYEEVLLGCAVLIIITNLSVVIYFAKKIIMRIWWSRKKSKKASFDREVLGISSLEEKSTSMSTL